MKFIFARGIHLRGGVTFGVDATFATLEQEGFEAVLVAVGPRESVRLPGAEGEEQGFHEALAFLTRVRKHLPPRLHGRVVVVGGGNVAVDAARTALRMGAADVTIACVESREAMPAFSREVEEAVAVGAKLLPGTAVKRFVLKDGMVTGFEALRVSRVDIDDQGRVVPRTVSGSEFDVRADAVLMAIGSRADLSFSPPAPGGNRWMKSTTFSACFFKAGNLKSPPMRAGTAFAAAARWSRRPRPAGLRSGSRVPRRREPRQGRRSDHARGPPRGGGRADHPAVVR